MRNDQVAANHDNRGRDERRCLPDKQREGRLGEAASGFLTAGTGADRDKDGRDRR